MTCQANSKLRPMKKVNKFERILEIIPGAISWAIIIFFVFLAFVHPITCAVILIIFDLYWIIRTIYLTSLLIIAYQKLLRLLDKDWFAESNVLSGFEKIHQLIIFPVYKEGLEILRPSLDALINSHYPKNKMIVVMAFEERRSDSREIARILELEYAGNFSGYISTFHPDGLPGEGRNKGANATWAAKKAKEYVLSKGLEISDIIVSCFDADTCVHPGYFGCLTYHFLTSPNPHQASYQPMPVYNNNIWYAPAFARLVEISSSFNQLIESMRLERFVTFSSHSMSFKTLVDIDYWPVDMISDDSVVYWKAFLHYDGQYRVVPLYTIVSMDVAYSRNIFKTIWLQYRQKRRWAWGVENFPFLMKGFAKNPRIPLITKVRRAYNLLESHITWAVWAVILMLIAPLPILLGGAHFTQIPIGYNLPRITGILLNFTLIASFVIIILSMLLLPPRPKDVKRAKYLVMVMEWIIVPFIILIVGSAPALDAQTRLMLGKYMEFQATEKSRFKKK